MSRTIAVTGATGFIGRHVLHALQSQNVKVVAVTRHRSKLQGVTGLHQIIEMDIGNPTNNSFSELGKPDILLHLAWDGLPNYRSLHHFETELPKQYRFLKSLHSSGLRQLLVTGTCFEYGMQSGELDEAAECKPENPYGFAKDVLRRQLTFLDGVSPFNLTWARLFYMYGAGQPPTSLWPQLQSAIARGDQSFDMSGGEQLRDYLPVEEVALSLVRLALLDAPGGVVNVCSGRPRSVRRLVEDWVRDARGTINLNIGHYPYPDFEPMAFWGSRGRLERLIRTVGMP